MKQPIQIAVTPNGQPQEVETETHLATVVRDAARHYGIPHEEALAMVSGWHNRYGEDRVYGPSYNGPKRVGDAMETILRPHTKAADAALLFAAGGIAGLVWVALIVALLARLAGLF